MTSDDKVSGWVQKGQNHDDVILEWSLSNLGWLVRVGQLRVHEFLILSIIILSSISFRFIKEAKLCCKYIVLFHKLYSFFN